MRRVELIYDSDCPNASATRANLLRAFAEAGQPAKWQEWERHSPDAPAYVRRFGSPTVLVDGRDVAADGAPVSSDSCRLYVSLGDGRPCGVPDVAIIRRAIAAKRAWLQHTTLLPAIGFGLLPQVACPACWPAYAGLLSSLGLGFLLSSAYALPLTVVSLGIAITGLAMNGWRRHDWRPTVLGSFAAVPLIAGKFVWNLAPMVYAGAALLVIAAVWNAWPRRAAGSCCWNSDGKEVKLYGTQGR